jgi:hypothetical protein
MNSHNLTMLGYLLLLASCVLLGLLATLTKVGIPLRRPSAHAHHANAGGTGRRAGRVGVGWVAFFRAVTSPDCKQTCETFRSGDLPGAVALTP